MISKTFQSKKSQKAMHLCLIQIILIIIFRFIIYFPISLYQFKIKLGDNNNYQIKINFHNSETLPDHHIHQKNRSLIVFFLTLPHFSQLQNSLLKIMLPTEHLSRPQPQHALKVRRVWTLTQPPQSYDSQEPSLSNDRSHFKPQTQQNSKLLHSKGAFISSLITKLKSVQRVETFMFSPRQPINKKAETQHSLKNGQKKSPQLFHNSNVSSHKQQNRHEFNSCPPNITQLLHPKVAAFSSLDELKLQNSILRQQMNELIIENERLKLRLNNYEQEWKLKHEQICRKVEQIAQRQAQLGQKEQLLTLKTNNFLEQQKITENSMFSLHLSSLKLQTSKKLSIYKEVDEVVLPVENEQLVKAQQEIRQLRVEKLQLQKKFKISLSQYRKKKEEELERIKRGFTSNLSHYKDLLLKVSMKSTQEPKKYQEDTFQTVILETSSADQS